MRINGRRISDQDPCYITFEAGPTHSGFESAKQLIELASQHGADAIKFQIVDPDRIVADKKQEFEYDILLDRNTGATRTVQEPLYDILKRRSLEKSEWRDLKQYADSLGLAFFATVGFEDEIELLQDIGCHSIKIASADLNHIPLLRLAAQTDMVVQIDTGNAALGEVEAAVDILKKAGCDNLIIHQCPSGYPAHLESIHLNMIPMLKDLFDCPVAYSDHTPGWEMDIAAVALGANLIEKTITMDRTTPSVEHIMSIEPEQMRSFVQSIRDLEVAMGSRRRKFSDEQIVKRNAVRRSLYVEGKAGDLIKDCQWVYRRPGYGITPDHHDHVMELRLNVDSTLDHPIEWKNLVS